MRPVAAALLLGVLATGCVLLEVRRQQEISNRMNRLTGSVSALVPADGSRVVVLIRRPDTSEGSSAIVDHYVLEGDGRFYFGVGEPGTYAIGAFHDLNRNLIYDLDEPARVPDAETTFTLGVGETLTGIELRIHPDERAHVEGPLDIRALVARSAREQLALTIGQLAVAGAIADLSDVRFGPESGAFGLWRPADFVVDLGPGIYFLEAFDPHRIPVLFVHGVSGYPQEFTSFIDQLDRERFQAWFAFYPSGAYLDRIAAHLDQLLVKLHSRHHFSRLFVVAHSMGGLVARSLLLHHEETTGDDCTRLFVTLSTPWDGHAAARTAVDRSPVVVDSWNDVAPGSPFLRGLFFRDPDTRRQPLALPEHTAYHLLFSFQRNERLPGASGDTVVTLASQLYPVAQREAESIFGFDANHAEILRKPEAIARVSEILAAAAD